MGKPDLPFDPLRKNLYSPAELLAGLDEARPASVAETLDFRIYRYWVKTGRYKPQYFDGMMQVLHDNAITQALADLLGRRKVVGIMGGHAMDRDSETYRNVARLARRVAQAGFFVASGGGPGAMEAAHLGALLAQDADTIFAAALADLARQSAFPADAGLVVDRDGTTNPAILAELFAWMDVAVKIRRAVAKPGASLGIPTWRYGHEPTSVFATHIAKYFENSVREDGLLSIAASGIVYTAGGAGTVQEVFQDAVFNAYSDPDRAPSPMIFFGTAYWSRMAVVPVLRQVFTHETFEACVAVTDDIEHVVDILQHVGLRAAGRDRMRRPAPSMPMLRRERLEPDDDGSWPV